jgi:hypothetical protein
MVIKKKLKAATKVTPGKSLKLAANHNEVILRSIAQF